MSSHYLAVWEFQVRPEFIAEFEQTYGSSGSWAALFCESPEFLGTELLSDLVHPGRYLTVDRWTSRQAFLRFKQERSAEYAVLDKNCERLTIAEKLVGDFESLTPAESGPFPQP